MAKAKKTDESWLLVTQTGSGIGGTKSQRATLSGLGLGKIGRSRVLQDSPAVRGMITKVNHLVEMAPAEAPAKD